MKIVFLDMDGVLNTYATFESPTTIGMVNPALAVRLNKLLMFTNARLVISSTWRNVIHNGHYSLYGFAHMLQTHGILSANVIGATGEHMDARGDEIREWLRQQSPRPTNYVILDDDSSGMDFFEDKFIKIDSRQGLQDEHVDRAIAMLGSEPFEEYEGVEGRWVEDRDWQKNVS